MSRHVIQFSLLCYKILLEEIGGDLLKELRWKYSDDDAWLFQGDQLFFSFGIVHRTKKSIKKWI